MPAALESLSGSFLGLTSPSGSISGPPGGGGLLKGVGGVGVGGGGVGGGLGGGDIRRRASSGGGSVGNLGTNFFDYGLNNRKGGVVADPFSGLDGFLDNEIGNALARGSSGGGSVDSLSALGAGGLGAGGMGGDADL